MLAGSTVVCILVKNYAQWTEPAARMPASTPAQGSRIDDREQIAVPSERDFGLRGASRDQLSSFMISVAPSTTITCTNLSVVNIRLKVAIVDAEF